MPASTDAAADGEPQQQPQPQQHPYQPLPSALLGSQIGRQLQLPPPAGLEGNVDDVLLGLLRVNLGPNAARRALGERLQGKVVVLDNPVAALTNKALQRWGGRAVALATLPATPPAPGDSAQLRSCSVAGRRCADVRAGAQRTP